MRGALAAILALGLAGCAAVAPPAKPKPGAIRINENPFPSTYQPYGSVPTLIRGATILDGELAAAATGRLLLNPNGVSGRGARALA